MRIAGGSWRGRRIEAAPGSRPTTERIREAVFSIWQSSVAGCRFLDLFCGGGAVGLEAASRGAGEVTFIDRDRRAVKAAARNIESLGLSTFSVRRLEIPQGLSPGRASELGMFDLAYADPPYDFEVGDRVLASIAELLRPGGSVAVEHDRRRELPECPALEPLSRRQYGDSSVSFFERRR